MLTEGSLILCDGSGKCFVRSVAAEVDGQL
jgi:hypothetical protein